MGHFFRKRREGSQGELWSPVWVAGVTGSVAPSRAGKRGSWESGHGVTLSTLPTGPRGQDILFV